MHLGDDEQMPRVVGCQVVQKHSLTDVLKLGNVVLVGGDEKSVGDSGNVSVHSAGVGVLEQIVDHLSVDVFDGDPVFDVLPHVMLEHRREDQRASVEDDLVTGDASTIDDDDGDVTQGLVRQRLSQIFEQLNAPRSVAAAHPSSTVRDEGQLKVEHQRSIDQPAVQQPVQVG